MPEPKTLDEIAIKHAAELRDSNSFYNEFTMRHHIRSALTEARDLRDKEWRTALFPNTPTVQFTPEMAAETVRAFVAEKRKALRELQALVLAWAEEDPDLSGPTDALEQAAVGIRAASDAREKESRK
jgi:hypothetical protein